MERTPEPRQPRGSVRTRSWGGPAGGRGNDCDGNDCDGGDDDGE
ncbi:hypothetical protein F750_2389 [Streptomyces sp. PAMC 26508]|nr:hypothetical protein F750_2389 [Streptomyces sp. PAMC 26508]